MEIGFIGTGAITAALVSGICKAKQSIEPIWVSPRNREKAEMLKDSFSQVCVGKSNQDVVDKVDVVFLAFLPKDREIILDAVEFRDEQIIINLLSGTKNSVVADAIGKDCVILRAVPLPCVAEHIGPIVIYPDHEMAAGIFCYLGTLISVDNEEQLENLSVITALMAPYFEMLATITDWATKTGVKQKQAADYTSSMFEALSVLARRSSTGNLHELANESMTPGGLNELARKTISESGGYEFLMPALQAVFNRVKGHEIANVDDKSR